MKRNTLYYSGGKGNWSEEMTGSFAVGAVLKQAGAKEEDFNILGDPAAAQKVVQLLKQLNEDVTPSGNGVTVQPSA